MAETMTIKSRCHRCSCAVELGFAPWAGSGPALFSEWTCPSCGESNHVPAIGEVNWVDLRARHAARPERTPPVTTH